MPTALESLDIVFDLFSGAREDAKKKQAAQEKQILIEGKGIDDQDERQAALRFQEQCYLMLRWREFADLNGVESEAFQQSRKAFYKNFAVVDHDTPFDFINRLFSKGPDADLLSNLTAEQLSLLVPTIRIFKIYVDPVTGNEYPIELPFDDSLSRREIVNITTTRAGRGQGAGLKSFSWKTEGRTPANQFQFSANMVLHFQSIEDIFLARDARTVQFASNKRQIDVRFSDLLIPARSFRKGGNTGPRAWDLDYFKIKVVVGWEVPNFRGVGGFIPQNVRDVLSRTFNSFILSILEHDMDVKEDGSVDLSIDFNTLPELLISEPLDANILFPSPETKLEIERLVDKIDRLTFEIENGVETGDLRDEENQQSLDPLSVGTSLSDPTDSNRRKIEERKQVLNQLAAFDNSKKTQSYRRILGGLYNRQALRFTLARKDFFKKRIKLKTREFQNNQEQLNFSNQLNTEEKNQELATLAGALNPDVKAMFDSNEFNDKQFKEAFNAVQRLDEFATGVPRGFYKIVYFYLGDLLDVVLDGMFKKSITLPDTFENKKVKTLLGSLTFYDYGTLTEHDFVGKMPGVNNEVQEIEKVYTGELSSVNLADVPIALREFSDWFNRKIVNEGREVYTFHEFVTDLINDLVVRAIKTECYDYAPRQQIKLTYQPITVPSNQKRTQLFRGSTRVRLEELEEIPFLTERHRALSDTQEVENYIIIHASIDNPWDLTGDYEADRQKGLYHLFYGNERGLVKRIKFKRADQPHIRAANIAANFNDAKGATKLLRGIYNADVEMVGNNLFTVGSQLRIVPSVGGGGSTIRLIDLVEDLGIGGYFLVLERQDTIESGVYSTDLKVVWTAPATQRKGGRLSVGDLENAVLINRRKSRTDGKSNSESSVASGGDIGNNVSNDLKNNASGTSLGGLAAFGAAGADKQ